MSSGIRQTSSGITWAEKIDPKLDHFLDASCNRFLDVLCWILVPKSILGWLCLPTLHQTFNKIVNRSMQRCIPSWTPFVECFLVGVCFQHRPIGSQKTRFFLRKKQGFLKHGLSMLKAIFDTILLPNMPQFMNIIQHNPPKDQFQEH